MSALIGNPMLLTSAPSGSGDAYQIEKSLKCSSADSSYLSRTFGLGNRRTFTWAGWVKRTKFGATQSLFNCHPSSNDKAYFHLHSEDKLGHNSYHSSTWWNGGTERSPELLRDPSAWMHVVFVMDTTNAEPDDRYRYYVNGIRLTHPGGDYGQNILNSMNTAVQHNIGGNHNNSDYGDFYLADIQFIDGLALSPAAFGQFNSIGRWDAKALALPAPNDGTTWSNGTFTLPDSSNAAVTWHSTAVKTRLFDGFADSSHNARPDPYARWEWTIPDIPCTASFRMNANSAGTPGVSTLTTDTGSVSVRIGDLSANEWVNYTLPKGTTKLTKLLVPGDSTNWLDVGAFEVDGVVLVDGQTDPTTRNNVNNGTVWSAGGSGSFNSGNALTSAFDGSHATSARPASGNTATWTAATSIPFTTLSINAWNDSVSDGIVVNGVNVSSSTAGNTGNQYIDITDVITSPLSTIVLKGVSNSLPTLKAIKVDGNVLVDSTVDNSFHLKFNDASTSAKLGRTSINDGKIEDATGGLPILKTKAGNSDNGIDYGDVKDTGTRTDSDSSNLLLAVPFDSTGATDYHATIKGSGTNRTFSNLSTAYATTTDSRFYGASANMDVGAVRGVKTSTSASDFEFGTGDFTIEWWAKYPDATSSNGYIASFQKDDFSGNPYPLYIYRTGNNSVNVWSSASVSDKSAWPGAPLGQWNHYALVRNGSGQTWTSYLDGAVKETWTTDAYNISTVDQLVIGDYEDGVLPLDGFIQDFRIYNKAKYTSNFITPTRNDWTVNNFITGTSTGTTTGGSWNTAFKDGNGGSWNAADDYVISSGASMSTNGNANRFFVDTDALGGGYELTIEKTGGTNNIYFAEQANEDPSATGSWDLVQNNISKLILTPAGANCDGTMKSHKRYVRCEGSGGGHVTFSITGILDLDEGTTTNISDIDSLVDTPTSYGDEDTGIGGEVRGNYCTWNPLNSVSDGSGCSLTNGNLDLICTSATSLNVKGTIAVDNKSYFEHKIISRTGFTGAAVGDKDAVISTGVGSYVVYREDGTIIKYPGNTNLASSKPTHSAGDVIGVGIDQTNVIFYHNGTLVGTYAHGITTDLFPFAFVHYNGGGAESATNFGQRAFKYTNAGTNRPSADYKCLCTQNIPDTFSGDELNNPSKFFGIKTYIGTGASHAIKGLDFKPDLLWIKSRNGNGYDHTLFDAIRGVNKGIYTNGTWAEDNYSQHHNQTSFDSNGWTMGAATHSTDVLNESGDSYVGWCWDAGTAAATASTDGSITPSAQWKNTAAGFSITKYTGTGSTATIGHALGAKPDFTITKSINRSDENWFVYHSTYNNAAEKMLYLDLDSVGGDSSTQWNDTAPTNTVITVGTANGTNGSSDTYVTYAWSAIPGYSAVGSWQGNSNNDGPFIHLGFNPKFVLFKNAASASTNWIIYDTERADVPGANTNDQQIHPDGTFAEGSGKKVDFVSNGIKIRDSNAAINGNNETYYYFAIAEYPFKTSRAR